jgi:hypothetical protein
VRKFVKFVAVSALSVSLFPAAVFSDENDPGASPKQKPEMTLEERRAAWESLSDEEKQVKREEMRARRDQMRAEWESMTPEEREVKRAEMQKRMESMTRR